MLILIERIILIVLNALILEASSNFVFLQISFDNQLLAFSYF